MKNIRVYTTEISFRCLKCGKVSTAREISEMSYLQCPECGFNILEKVRRERVKEVLAR